MLYSFSLPYPISVNQAYRQCVAFKGTKGFVHTIISKAARDYKIQAAWEVEAQKNKLGLQGILFPKEAVGVSLVLRPKLTRSGRPAKQTPDLDNVKKITYDSLIEVIFKDDKQIKFEMAYYGAPKIGGGVDLTFFLFADIREILPKLYMSVYTSTPKNGV